MKNTDKPRLNTTDRPIDIDAIPVDVHPSKGIKFANYFIGFALVVVAIAIGIFLKWSFTPDNVLEIHNSPFPARVVNDPTGNTGGVVFLNANYCKNSSIEGELRMSYVSQSREIFLPITKEQLPKGCESKEVPVVIPKGLQTDTYKIKFRATYSLNPLKSAVSTDFESQSFKVGAQPN